MNKTLVISQIEDRIGTITLNRPEKRNALNSETVAGLQSAFDFFSNNPQVRAIVLKATGDAFCAGADLGYLQQLQKNTFDENLADSLALKNLFYTIYTCPKPVIAQVQGHAIAGGAGLVSVCDFVFSVPEAQFGFTEVKIGFVPAIVGVFAIRKFPENVVRKLFLTGELISSANALNIGLITQIVASDVLENSVLNFVQQLINTTSGESVRLTKKLLTDLYGKNMEESLDYAARLNATARSTNDCQIGIQAFLNKQKINW